MIIDVTGTILTPGNVGKNCPGNGNIADIECCCDECDYQECCMEDHDQSLCLSCQGPYCPNASEHIQHRRK